MIRVLLLACVIVLVALAASWLRANPGSVTVEWLGWRADTSVAMLAFLIALVTMLGAASYRFWRFLRRAPDQLSQVRRARRNRRGYEALSSGMIAVASGESAEAQRQARRAESLLTDTSATKLLRAEAARLTGDASAARRTYEEMSQDPDTALLGIRGLLDHADAAGDKAEALRLAEKAHRLQPKAQGAAQRLFDLQVELGQWDAADRTLSEAMKQKIVPRSQGKLQRAAVLIERSRNAEQDGDTESALALAREANRLDPDLVPAAVQHAWLLKEHGRAKRAPRVLEAIWSRHPHPDIAAAYGDLVDGEDRLSRVKRFQRLLSFRPDHVEGHLALAEAALAAQLWGEARAHLRQAAERSVTPRLCRMMAELEESEHDDFDSARAWLQRAAAAEPDSAWVCDACGATAGAWNARCGNCGAFDKLGWHPPPRIRSLPEPEPTAYLPKQDAGDEKDEVA